MSFPNRGEGGVPHLGKIPTFSRFFCASFSTPPLLHQMLQLRQDDAAIFIFVSLAILHMQTDPSFLNHSYQFLTTYIYK